MGGAWSLDKRGKTAVLTIDKPPLNLVAIDDLIELGERLAEVRGDGGIRSLIITGKGDAFIGGADISEFGRLDPVRAKFGLSGVQRVLRDMEQMELPVVAAVNGYAFGGGCEVALACDIRICSERARFGQLEINYGVIPGWAATQRLTRIVGFGRAKEMVLTGRVIEPPEALQAGLVSRVVPGSELMERAVELAQMLASKAPIAMALAKELVNASVECSFPVGGNYEAAACALTMGTEDCLEGVRSFMEKRKPDFEGR